MKSSIRGHYLAWLLLAPTIAIMVAFMGYPMLKTIFLSSQLTDLAGNPIKFVGFENFIHLLKADSFQTSLMVTLIFVCFTTILTIVIAYGLALLTKDKFLGIDIFRTLISSTMGVSVTVASILWLFIFNPQSGLFSISLKTLHLSPINWLSDPLWSLIAIIGTTTWMNLGFAYLILLGSLQSIPDDLYRVANLHGASWWLTLRKITLPATKPTVFFVSVVTLINAFQTFGQVDILTAGGPDFHTNLMVYAIYQDAFVNHNVGRASAQSIVLTFIIMIVTLIQFWWRQKRQGRSK
ncbi:sugar ABC transporter permease [Weissella diestrammenae]|uniref:Sugar ABC transporter permease n=1 Tax=Weissella diestrammenae TaxID=1162633 RepID=A0A7G9T567_9LACO|nr:sugar ABC transporter permease [Weissella diestrammenae]MCM0583098.1 sugar ABC transporter permease [Weissella diestrammenae]QNN75242.1 sugar ABC transporter permease [Weissella diestrammenae]